MVFLEYCLLPSNMSRETNFKNMYVCTYVCTMREVYHSPTVYRLTASNNMQCNIVDYFRKFPLRKQTDGPQLTTRLQ